MTRTGVLLGIVASGRRRRDGASYGIKVGYSSQLFWHFWGLIAAIVYGAYAISVGLREVARLARRWNAPLRTLKRPTPGAGRQ